MKQTAQWHYRENGFFELICNDHPVMMAHAEAYTEDGRRIDTRTAALRQQQPDSQGMTLVFEDENGLILTEVLKNETSIALCRVSDRSGAEIAARRLIPLVIQADSQNTCALWKSLWTKMLLVPYDNTMWLRYEAQPLRAGRKSYDMTVLFCEQSREGLLIGALDHDVWKNAIIGSASDAKTLNAQSGIADEGTHDSVPHGAVSGKEVSSARFCVLYGGDYRDLLEQYGERIASEQKPLQWKEGVPFGFNSWAGLAFRLNEKNYQATGQFLREKLSPAGYANQGVTYANLDAGWNVIPEDTLISLVDELHENGQKAGIYDAPFAFFGEDCGEEIPGVPGHCFEEILVKDEAGRLLPRVDGAIPFDVTHPLWRAYTQWKFDRFVRWNFDYVKIDFLTHGGMEGVHYDPAVHTGRQALTQGYTFLRDLLAPERIGRPFFISLSIAPLFPCGYGHARRFSCDAFGTNEDVEYVLNAQTDAWWQNGRLYAMNDPDHICLLRSFGMERDSTEGEARARYTSAVIAGTVMMLSDDYEREEARARAIKFSGNREVNQIAASRVSFRPVESGNASASPAFTAEIGGKRVLAWFHWGQKKEILSLSCHRAGLPTGITWRDLWSGKTVQEPGDELHWEVDGCDAILLRED